MVSTTFLSSACHFSYTSRVFIGFAILWHHPQMTSCHKQWKCHFNRKCVRKLKTPSTFFGGKCFRMVSASLCLLGFLLVTGANKKTTEIPLGNSPTESLQWSLPPKWVHLERVFDDMYMAQSLHIVLYGFSTNLPFGICAIYFDRKVIIDQHLYVYLHIYICTCSYIDSCHYLYYILLFSSLVFVQTVCGIVYYYCALQKAQFSLACS